MFFKFIFPSTKKNGHMMFILHTLTINTSLGTAPVPCEPHSWTVGPGILAETHTPGLGLFDVMIVSR